VIALEHEPNSRGGSRTLYERFREGDELTISAPRNRFPLAKGTHHVLLAGGIGVTPIMSMARYLQSRGRSFELQYFARSTEHAAFLAELQAPEFIGHLRLHVGLDPDPLEKILRELLRYWAPGHQLYHCGPVPFMHLVQLSAALYWPPAAVHCEYSVQLAGRKKPSRAASDSASFTSSIG
jgi:vanillate O-demethylase ferredoxin subunit